jgi:probable F420-dependent oxidoreductase
MTLALGRLGVWAHWSRLTGSLAAELERIGYTAIWVGGSPRPPLTVVEDLLAATERLVVATGVVNIWRDDAHSVAACYHRIVQAHPNRFLLGIGVGHPESVPEYRRPYQAIVEYLDVLDEESVPPDRRILAALQPRLLRLSAERTAGAHPYLTTPEHTRNARRFLGTAILAPEQKVIIETDLDKARTLARRAVVKPYFDLRNYVANLGQLGWTAQHFTNGGSDRLIDALVAHGDAAAAASRIRHHLHAGANHVAVQLLTTSRADPAPGYQAVAEAIGG